VRHVDPNMKVILRQKSLTIAAPAKRTLRTKNPASTLWTNDEIIDAVTKKLTHVRFAIEIAYLAMRAVNRRILIPTKQLFWRGGALHLKFFRHVTPKGFRVVLTQLTFR